jgi:phosphoenolpyruvate carboxykinase (ATP)
MSQVTSVERKVGLDAVGLGKASKVYWSLGVAALYEEALKRGEGQLTIDGPIVCNTAPHTGRSPNDKFIV